MCRTWMTGAGSIVVRRLDVVCPKAYSTAINRQRTLADWLEQRTTLNMSSYGRSSGAICRKWMAGMCDPCGRSVWMSNLTYSTSITHQQPLTDCLPCRTTLYMSSHTGYSGIFCGNCMAGTSVWIIALSLDVVCFTLHATATPHQLPLTDQLLCGTTLRIYNENGLSRRICVGYG